MEEQRSRLHALQRGHAQLEQAFGYVQKTRSEATRRPTPRESPAEKQQAPVSPRTPQRTPTAAEAELPRSPRSQPNDSRGSASPRNQARGSGTPRSQSSQPAPERSMVRSSSDSKVDDRYYDGLAIEKRAWPPYPEWQDLPLRRFGKGYCKKLVPHLDSHMGPGGCVVAAKDDWHLTTQHRDEELMDGLPRALGHGRRKYMDANKSHLEGYGVVAEVKDEQGRTLPSETYVDDLRLDFGKGKHKFWEKDHLRNDVSTDASSMSSLVESSSRVSARSSRSTGALSRPRSSRSSRSSRAYNPMG